MNNNKFHKDPNEKKDYVIDWSGQMSSTDSIISSSWTDDTGDLTISSETFDTFSTKALIAGGTEDVTYKITNQVQTTEGLILETSIYLRIVDK